MHFVKMHGAGNDYVLSEDEIDEPAVMARRVCDRHMGIGSDGLILLHSSACADIGMRIFNADGSEAEMCGNGARCAAKFLHDEGKAEGGEVRIETPAGVRRTRLLFDEKGRVFGAEVDMGVPEVSGKSETIRVEERSLDGFRGSLDGFRGSLNGFRVGIGNPHFVVFVEEAAKAPVEALGPGVERAPLFPNRTNVEFVQVLDKGSLLVRVWERGSGETLACGTGAVAAAAAAMSTGRLEKNKPVGVLLPGGELTVCWDGSGPALLSGEAVTVFRGVWP